MQDLIAALVSFFLIEPLQTKMADKLAAARAPQAVLTEVTACARAAGPVIVERVTGDPWWGVSTTVQVWLGSATPETILADASPTCRPAIEAARPFLTGRGA